MKIRSIRVTACSLAVVALAFIQGPSASLAISPAEIQQGRQLFERDWPSRNPAMGSDGLGPLFNARSCVACHHQRGVGGGGDSRFNAKTVGIETMQIVGGPVTDDVIANMVSSFHPGFVQASGTVSNTFTVAHHGGSPQLLQARKALLSLVPAVFSDHGGPINAEETRQSYATPIRFTNQIGRYQVSLRARLFQRNTTALFGSGLIDQVSEKEIAAHAKAQKSHPEISGRPSTLDDGRFGKFGWRANVATLLEFNDQACANEVGLETKRKPQARDPMVPAYRNPSIDIADQQIKTLTSFVAALPAPVREIPSDSELQWLADRGESVFNSVGCAICHVPNMGPARGIYSDLLLHDMGYESIDLNLAEPYRVAATPIILENKITSTTLQSINYYGRTSTISSRQSTGPRTNSGTKSKRRSPPEHFNFVAPTHPAPFNIVDLGSRTTFSTSNETKKEEVTTSRRSGTASTTTTQRTRKTEQLLMKVHYEQTNLKQEWRTPPLWGVRDSAPYMHDGRAETLLESIAMHDGESAGTRDRFLNLPLADRHAVIAFLETLVAPPGVPQPAL